MTATIPLDRTILQGLDFDDMECQSDDCASDHKENAAYLVCNTVCGCVILLCPACLRIELIRVTQIGLFPALYTCTLCNGDFFGRLIDLIEVRSL